MTAPFRSGAASRAKFPAGPDRPAVLGSAGASWPRQDMRYRADVDGLRALAVLAVMLFHGRVPGFGGGFVGVDIFFVISGYLITGICLNDISAGTFTIAGFYERRARRIIPALAVVVAATLLAGFSLMTPDELMRLSESVVSVAFFVSNFHFMSETGYFATASELKPLLHTWSLAVEEQYYLVAPLALVIMARFRPVFLVALTASLAVLSLGFAEWAWRELPDWNFFLTPSRVWELMIGALARFAQADGGPTERTGPKTAHALSLAGLAAILCSIILMGEGLAWPSLAALVPTLGTAAVILFSRPGGVVHRLLSLPPVVGLGLISYSAYLWHQPLFAYARLSRGVELSGAATGLLMLASLAVAYLSWRFVERPFRNRRRLSRRQVLGLAGSASLALAAVAAAVIAARGMPQRYGEPERSFFASLDELSGFRAACHWQEVLALELDRPCRIGAQDVPPTLAVWGDSHAEALGPALDRALAERGKAGLLIDKGGCAPVPGYIPGLNAQRERTCARQNAAALARLRKMAKIDTVVLVGRWDIYADAEPLRPLKSLAPGAECSPEGDALADGLAATACLLRAMGKRVVLLRQAPYLEADPIGGLYDRAAGLLDTDSHTFALPHSTYLATAGNTALAPLEGKIELVDPYPALCTGGVCLWAQGGLPFYRDRDHPAGPGAERIADHLLDVLSLRGD